MRNEYILDKVLIGYTEINYNLTKYLKKYILIKLINESRGQNETQKETLGNT